MPFAHRENIPEPPNISTKADGEHKYASLSLFLGPHSSFQITDTLQAPDIGISPALLTRAGNLAAEHSKLSAQLEDSFDTKIAKRVGELASIARVLQAWNKENEVCMR